jgi:hypothetical protein
MCTAISFENEYLTEHGIHYFSAEIYAIIKEVFFFVQITNFLPCQFINFPENN